MKTIIQTHKEGKHFVAVDLVTNVADQGLTEEAATPATLTEMMQNLPSPQEFGAVLQYQGHILQALQCG